MVFDYPAVMELALEPQEALDRQAQHHVTYLKAV